MACLEDLSNDALYLHPISSLERGFPGSAAGAADTSPFSSRFSGRIEGHAAGDDWFLSGYTMEDFVRRFAQGASSKPATVELSSAKNGVNAGYLAHIAEDLKNRQFPLGISPYEQIDETVDRTFIVNDGMQKRKPKRVGCGTPPTPMGSCTCMEPSISSRLRRAPRRNRFSALSAMARNPLDSPSYYFAWRERLFSDRSWKSHS